MAWPVSMVEVAAGQSLEYILFNDIATAELIAVTDIETVEAFSFKWRSWAWQRHNVPQASLHMRPGVRGFRCTETMPIVQLAAQCGWWQLPRATLLMVGEMSGMQLDSTDGNFEVLFSATKQALKCSDQRVFEALEHRMGELMSSAKCMSEILQVDEAAQCLREDDRREVEVEQQRATTRAQEVKEFRKKFREKRASVRKASSGQRRARIPYSGPKKLPAQDDIPQSVAKQLLPPDSSLWRARNSGAWVARHRNLPTRSARISAWGSERSAIFECVRHAWQCYLDLEGLDTSQCPVKGLFPEDLVESVPSARARARSST